MAGGYGTRLRHIVSDVPKPMAPVAGRPFLSYLLDNLAEQQFDHVVLSTGYMHEKIEQYYGTLYNGMAIDYACELTPLGTGGGMLNALQKCGDGAVVVLNGDTYFAIDYGAVMRYHSLHGADLTVVLRWVDDVARYGAVMLDEEDNIISFVEKNATVGGGLINGGIYVMKRSLMDDHRVGDRFSFETDILQARYRQARFKGYQSDGYFIDIGVPEDYSRAQQHFMLNK